jgi:hypothetical protein
MGRWPERGHVPEAGDAVDALAPECFQNCPQRHRIAVEVGNQCDAHLAILFFLGPNCQAVLVVACYGAQNQMSLVLSAVFAHVSVEPVTVWNDLVDENRPTGCSSQKIERSIPSASSFCKTARGVVRRHIAGSGP